MTESVSLPTKSQLSARRNRMNVGWRFGALLFACLGLAATTAAADAQTYPNRPVRWVVGYPAGGSTDIIARLVGHRLSERLGQQFIIENKPGAGNNIATESVVNAAPDGYTIL